MVRSQASGASRASTSGPAWARAWRSGSAQGSTSAQSRRATSRPTRLPDPVKVCAGLPTTVRAAAHAVSSVLRDSSVLDGAADSTSRVLASKVGFRLEKSTCSSMRQGLQLEDARRRGRCRIKHLLHISGRDDGDGAGAQPPSETRRPDINAAVADSPPPLTQAAVEAALERSQPAQEVAGGGQAPRPQTALSADTT